MTIEDITSAIKSHSELLEWQKAALEDEISKLKDENCIKTAIIIATMAALIASIVCNFIVLM